jgi:hypothetical protein
MKLKKLKNVNATSNGWFVYLFCTIIAVTALFDLVTFLYSSTKAFEINPLYLFSGSVTLMIILKCLVTFGIIYILVKKPSKEWVQFMFISLATYLILLQLAGGISNLETHSAQPPETAILPVEQAVTTYSWTILLQMYAPVIMSTLIFLFWSWCYPTKKNGTKNI